MFINQGRNRTVLFIRQVTGPDIPVNPGIPKVPTPPPLPYPTDNIIDTFDGLGIEYATQFINAVAFDVKAEAIKAFDYKSKIDAAVGLHNLNLSELSKATLKSIDQVNAAQERLIIIGDKGYLLPEGSNFIIELINIESFNEKDIEAVLKSIKDSDIKPKNDKFSSADLESFFNEYFKD